MSGVDVVASLDRAIFNRVNSGYADASELSVARNAIAELIAAVEEYDAALRAFNNTTATSEYWPQMHDRLHAAEQRRAAALAACKPKDRANGGGDA